MTIKELVVFVGCKCLFGLCITSVFTFLINFFFLDFIAKKSSYDIANTRWWFKMFYMMFLWKIVFNFLCKINFYVCV